MLWNGIVSRIIQKLVEPRDKSRVGQDATDPPWIYWSKGI